MNGFINGYNTEATWSDIKVPKTPNITHGCLHCMKMTKGWRGYIYWSGGSIIFSNGFGVLMARKFFCNTCQKETIMSLDMSKFRLRYLILMAEKQWYLPRKDPPIFKEDIALIKAALKNN